MVPIRQHGLGNSDAARFRQAFEPRCHIHTVAEDVIAVVDDVAKIDADAVGNAAVFRNIRLAAGHFPLHRNSAENCAHYA